MIVQPFPQELKHLYKNIEFIGSGGFAKVFKATRNDGKIVAVKIPLNLDEVTGKIYLREITAWQRLAHRNIITLFDANILPIPYLELEYLDGGNLEDLRKPLEIAQACEIVFNICEGLNYAHKQGILHRDVKPQNILLTKEKVPKITDWGMSRIIAESKSSIQLGFSPVYAAPEQVSPKKFGKPDERTDVYQLGVIFYNLITDDLPFKGEDLAEIASAIVLNDPVPPSISNLAAREVEHIVLRCLSKKKDDRYQSVEEFQQELSKFMRKRKWQEESKRKEREVQKKDEQILRVPGEVTAPIERKEVELGAQNKGRNPQKRILAAALVIAILFLGYWMLGQSMTNVPKPTNSTHLIIPEATSIVSPAPIVGVLPKTFSNSIGMDFVLIPEGEFDMGSENEKVDEKPVHHVRISEAFYMGKYEVTQKQWVEVMGNNPSDFKGDDLPVEDVSWNDVQDFVKKLNEKEGRNYYRLPSEAEWEYAARSGTSTRYFFGDEESNLSDYAWYTQNSGMKMHPVGQKKPNPWGLYDMYGNSWEWVQDLYHINYNGAPEDGSAWETDTNQRIRVYRGGGYNYVGGITRSAIRGVNNPETHNGFRLVMEIKPDINQTQNITQIISALSPEKDQKTFSSSTGIEFALIPAGQFDMGSPENEKGMDRREHPVHRVIIPKSFYMGKYEVTQKQWQDVMDNNPSFFKGDNRPVENVSWYDVQKFIEKLNENEGTNKYRLPSEAEWEYAIRAGTNTTYFFGNNKSELGDYAWYSEIPDKTHPVGQKRPNPWGLYDMRGNVLEWVQDIYHEGYRGAPSDGSAWEGTGSNRVIRGWGVCFFYNNLDLHCRSASREFEAQGNHHNGLGFRLVMDT